MLNLVVREIVERAQNDRLEHHNRIPRLASRPRFTRLVRTPPHRLKTRAQVFPRNHPVDLQKRLVLGVKTGIPVPKIEKPHLTHQPRLPLSTNRQPDSKSTTPEKEEFLEVPLSRLLASSFAGTSMIVFPYDDKARKSFCRVAEAPRSGSRCGRGGLGSVPVAWISLSPDPRTDRGT